MNGTCCIGVMPLDTWNAAQARSKRECGEGYAMKENNPLQILLWGVILVKGELI
jgi:hypothetical protein